MTEPASALTIVPPTAPLVGRVVLPGSKSITNRMLLIAALARGTSRLTGALKSDDTIHMAAALRQLGVQVEEPDATSFVVTASGTLQPSHAPLFLGNAGTAMRFLTAVATTIRGTTVLDGDAHMRKRPIAPLVDALTRMGVATEAPTGCPPVRVQGSGLPGGRVVIDAGLSSQYVSALLIAAACADDAVEIVLAGGDIGARGYIDLTLAAMATFGGTATAVSDRGWRVSPTGYQAADAPVEPDASAATYLWAAEALTGGAIDIGLSPDRFSQPDAKAQACIAAYPDMPPVIDGSQMQDAIPTLAVLAAFNNRPVRFTGIANLRVKECDRTRALCTELNRIRSGLAEEQGDDLLVHGDRMLAGQMLPTAIETYSDHRIAMAFALAGLKIGGIRILDPGCVAKTYPGYWDALASLGVQLLPDA